MDKDPHEHSIKDIKGIGPQRAKLFSRLGILTIQDALYYLPCRYEDRRALKKIAELSPGRHLRLFRVRSYSATAYGPA